MTISCIGSGNMGTALIKGALSLAAKPAEKIEIGFADADASKAQAAAAALGGKVFPSNAQAVQEGDYVFLAVKPQVFERVLAEIAPAVTQRLSQTRTGGTGALVLVSMAPGWSIGKIQAVLGVKAPVIRIMPNTPALISRGVIAMTVSPEVPAAQSAELEKLLGGAGMVDRLEEKYMDAVTGLSGSGPAFTYLFIEALADGGVRAGLPRDKALRYAAQTVQGAAAMVMETGKHPGELKDMVASPGGTTIAGITALENGGFRAAAINAVEAAWKRSTELG
ncbi:MAG: pyrroline-5-carboxylate reductase [Treponema sp.]|nr:pyrroline-5-carboxylate reductase [Treponema sp.]